MLYSYHMGFAHLLATASSLQWELNIVASLKLISLVVQYFSIPHLSQ